MSDAQGRGRFVWYELLTTDPGSARGFYEDVVGWGTQEWEGGPAPYTMWMRGETPVGGLMQLPEEAAEAGAPAQWLAYVATPDVDASVARARELGASVQAGPMDIPTVGRMAVLSDPQGAAFAVYKPETETDPGEYDPAVLDFSWHELATTDHEAAFAFYSELFGWEKTDAMDMGPIGVYQMYGQGGKTYGGMFNKPAEMPGPPAWILYARVEDVDSAAERVAELGGQVVNGPMEVPGGDRIVQGVDPQGAFFALHSRKAAED